MIHDRDLADQILFVGPEERAPQLSKLSLVALGRNELGALTATDIPDDANVVLFATDVSDAQLAAIAQLRDARGSNMALVALCDHDLPLSQVRALMSAGVSEVLPASMSPEEIEAALQNLASRRTADRVAAESDTEGAVFAVAQARGGVGATSVAVNLAVSLANQGRRSGARRVAVLDLDLQFGNVGTYLDVEDNGGLLDLVAHAGVPGRDRLLGCVQKSAHGVDVITAPSVFVPLTSVSPELTHALVDALRRRYDFVVIDLPHAALDWVAPVVQEASRLILVSDESVPCIRQAKRLCDLYREARVTLPVELVMNREKRHLFKSETLQEAEELLGVGIAAWLPEDTAAHRRAVDFGEPAACRRTRTRKHFRKWASRLASSSAGATPGNRETADVQ